MPIRCTPSSLQKANEIAHDIQAAEQSDIPCAMALRLFALSPEYRASCLRPHGNALCRWLSHLRELDANH